MRQRAEAVISICMNAPPPDFQAIYLDTNPLLIAEWPGVSVALGNLLYGAHEWWGIPAFIPEPVLIEAEEHWIRDFQNGVCGLRNAAQQIKRKAGSVPCETNAEHTSLDVMRDRYRTMQDETMRRFEVGIIPFGTKSVEEFFGLATRYIRPFKDGGQGSGFQDAVILQSVLEHLHPDENRKGIFITQDAVLKKTSLEAFFPGFGVDRIEFIELETVRERLVRSHVESHMIAPWREEMKNALRAAEANKRVWQEFLAGALKESMLRGTSGFGTSVTVLKLISVDSITIRSVDTPIPEPGESPDRNVTVSVEATADCTALLRRERFDFLAWFSDTPRIERPPEPPEIVEGKVHWAGKIRATADVAGRQFSNFRPEEIEPEKE